MTTIPDKLISAFDSTGRIKTPALFSEAVAQGLILDTSGNDKTRGKRLAQLLRGWNIRPQTIRFPDQIANGYYKSQFEWAIKTGQPLPPHFVC